VFFDSLLIPDCRISKRLHLLKLWHNTLSASAAVAHFISPFVLPSHQFDVAPYLRFYTETRRCFTTLEKLLHKDGRKVDLFFRLFVRVIFAVNSLSRLRLFAMCPELIIFMEKAFQCIVTILFPFLLFILLLLLRFLSSRSRGYSRIRFRLVTVLS